MGNATRNRPVSPPADPCSPSLAIGAGLGTENVTGEAIDGALPTMPAVTSHLRALSSLEVVSSRLTHDRTCGRGDGGLCAPGPISWRPAAPEPQPQGRAMVWIQARQKHALSMCDRPKNAKLARLCPGPGRIRPMEAAERRRVGRYWLIPNGRVRNWRAIPSWRRGRTRHQAGIRHGWTPAASADVLPSEKDMAGFLNDRTDPHLPHILLPG